MKNVNRNIINVNLNDITDTINIDYLIIYSSITEDLSDLRDGIYTATLVVDGITKDSKRIIISN